MPAAPAAGGAPGRASSDALSFREASEYTPSPVASSSTEPTAVHEADAFA